MDRGGFVLVLDDIGLAIWYLGTHWGLCLPVDPRFVTEDLALDRFRKASNRPKE
nr:MAG: hypothetical protein H4BulkLitter2428196_000001 [Mitovirus sp.]